MPVSFFIDPAIAGDRDVASLGTVTLSYTFYPLERPARITEASAATYETAQQPH